MPTFKLDDREIPFEPGDTIIRAAWRQGIEIPHYCWHPGLSVAANCRMCLVEIKSGRPMMLPILKWDAQKGEYVDTQKPKLQPACQQTVAEGLEVSTKSDEVKKAHASVQEFLLLNHPVDCPICDQAGECKLQDYWLDHQATLKRKHSEPVHKPKAVRFGPTIVYDGERCVMCTRCIRFCDEVVGDHVLEMRERGNRNEITVAPGRELDHDYTLMTEHVCPVGALTSKDFRFKARVWFLKSAPSVCTGCATGCNTWVDFDPRYNKVQRLRPRDNAEVNKFWMCDAGMMTYVETNEQRIAAGTIGRGEARRDVPRSMAIAAARDALAAVDRKRVAVVLSAGSSTEDNFALARFAKDALGTEHVYLAAKAAWKGDKILRHEDQNPNRRGAELAAGGALESLGSLAEEVLSGEIDAVVALGHAVAEDAGALAAVNKLSAVVSLASNVSVLSDLATVVVPVAAVHEASGTFVNAKGMAQSFARAVPAPFGIKPAWETIGELAAAMGKPLPFGELGALRRAMPATTNAARPVAPEARA